MSIKPEFVKKYLSQINLADQFVKTANENAEKTAVIYNEAKLSFGNIKNKGNILASVLYEQIRNKKPVAVYMEKNPLAVIADIGILLSGNFFMNLDVKNPVERISAILNQIQPALVITNRQNENVIKSITDNVIIIEDVLADGKDISDDGVYQYRTGLIDTDPSCIINTSGSTGTPKGVVLNHKSFFDFVAWAQDTFHFGTDEVIGCVSPLVFDIYVFELCMLMFHSATMVLVPDGLATFPIRLLQYLEAQKPTFFFWVPTIMVNIANADLLSHVDLSTLRNVWFAGEVFPTKQFNYWYRKLPSTRFANLYGPIEITLDCTYYIIDHHLDDLEPIPTGYPCRNSDVFLLTSENTLAKVNEEGEICVRGTSLAMGYYNNPEKTAVAFTQNPLNKAYPELIYRTGDMALVDERGLIMFKGRRDTLVKHQGYRIELGEIEHVIVNTLGIVKNGCVIYNHAEKQIIFIYENPEEISAATFRKQIVTVLPKYMVPTRFVRMDELPRNTNGKIDRYKLKVAYGD